VVLLKRSTPSDGLTSQRSAGRHAGVRRDRLAAMAEELGHLRLHPGGAREQRRDDGFRRDLRPCRTALLKLGIVAIQLSMVRRQTSKRSARVSLVAPSLQALRAIPAFFGL
jgi:hypothetical protein